jgi:hypothetical protein
VGVGAVPSIFWIRLLFGSGYFLDPDGNRLEIYTDMMQVPNGEPFPRQEYAAMLDALKAEAGAG